MLNSNTIKGLLISDFNIRNFSGYLDNDTAIPQIQTNITDFAQIMESPTGNHLLCFDNDTDFALLWTRPEGVISSFKKVLNYEDIKIEDIEAEVDVYASFILRLRERVRFVFIPSWVISPYNRGYGILNLKQGIGISNILMRMNLRLAFLFAI